MYTDNFTNVHSKKFSIFVNHITFYNVADVVKVKNKDFESAKLI